MIEFEWNAVKAAANLKKTMFLLKRPSRFFSMNSAFSSLMKPARPMKTAF